MQNGWCRRSQVCGGLCRRLRLSKVFCAIVVALIQWISFLLPLYPGMKSPGPWAIYPSTFISIIYSYILIRPLPHPHSLQREAFYFENPFCTFELENIVLMFPFTSCGPLGTAKKKAICGTALDMCESFI